MTKTDGGPSKSRDIPTNPTLRDWLAGQALAGMNAAMIATGPWPGMQGGRSCLILARAAYAQADAMLAARDKETGE